MPDLSTWGSKFRVLHTTRYKYSEPVSASLHHAVLEIRPTPWQTVNYSQISSEPAPSMLLTRKDYFGNNRTCFGIDSSARHLRVEVESEVVLHPTGHGTREGIQSLDELRATIHQARTPHDMEALEFVFESQYVPRSDVLARYAMPSFTGGQSMVASVTSLMQRIHAEFAYDPAVTDISTPVEEVLSRKGGVCQDFAHLMIACLRSLDVPTRYVSGYLVPLPGVVGDQASHAWVSVYVPQTGWVDFDPTNNVRPTTGHITLAWGRDYADVSPLRGVMLGGGSHTVAVEVRVRHLSQTEEQIS